MRKLDVCHQATLHNVHLRLGSEAHFVDLRLVVVVLSESTKAFSKQCSFAIQLYFVVQHDSGSAKICASLVGGSIAQAGLPFL